MKWHISPTSTLKKTQAKCFMATLLKLRTQLPDLFPLVSSACSQGKAGELSQQTLCCSSASFSMDVNKGCNLPMDSLSIHMWNMLGSGVSKP